MARLYLYGARMCIPGYEQCPIKLGITSDPQARCRGMQGTVPFPLEWLGAWPAKRGIEAEKEAFRMFAPQRLSGEWFSPSESLLNFIQEHVNDYQGVIERHKGQRKTPTGRIPKDVNSWIRNAEASAYSDFAGKYYAWYCFPTNHIRLPLPSYLFLE